MAVTNVRLSCPYAPCHEDVHGREIYLHLFVKLVRPKLLKQMCGQLLAPPTSTSEIMGSVTLCGRARVGTRSWAEGSNREKVLCPFRKLTQIPQIFRP